MTDLERNDKTILCPLIHHRFKNLGYLVHFDAKVTFSRLNLVFRLGMQRAINRDDQTRSFYAYHLLSRQEEVAHSGCEVVHRILSKNRQFVTNGAKEPQVVVHRYKSQGVQNPRSLYGFVRR